MPTALIAQFAGYSITHWAVFIVLAAAFCALVTLALKNFGINVPPFVLQALWIVVIAFVVIAAIIFLSRLAGGA